MGRTFRNSAACLLAGALLFAGPALAAQDYPADLMADEDAVRLQPSSQWALDYAENRCRLARLFEAEGERHFLLIEQAAPARTFQLTMAGPEMRLFRRAREIDLGLQQDAPVREEIRVAVGDLPSVGMAIIVSSIGLRRDTPRPALFSAGIDLEEGAKVERIVMSARGRTISFETGNMRAAFEALSTCTFDLLRDWGLDPEQHRTYTPPRWSNEAEVGRRILARYPTSAARRGEQGIFRLRVIVETDGKVSDCHIEKTTDTKVLESPACTHMMDALFEPALDAAGNPMRSFFSTAISYRM